MMLPLVLDINFTCMPTTLLLILRAHTHLLTLHVRYSLHAFLAVVNSDVMSM